MNVKRKIYKVIWNRWTANIIFWAIIFLTKLSDRPANSSSSFWLYISLFTIFQIILLEQIYINNLYLAPKLLPKRKYARYFIYVLSFSGFNTIIYWALLKIVYLHIPSVKYQWVSTIMPGMTESMEWDAILSEGSTILIVFILLTGVFTMAWYMRDYLRQQKLVEDAQKKQAEAELSFLKSQINPHFLFNTLNNLYSLALKKSENTPDAILKLSSILRYLLYEASVEKIDFEKEKEVIQAYVDLEMLRLSDSAKFEFNVRTDNNDKIPPLLWMPVLENIFKHGTRTLQQDMSIQFSFQIREKVLKIYSRNPARSMVLGEKKESGGLGLDNLRKRLQLLYPGRHSLSSHMLDNDYITEVTVKLNGNESYYSR